MVEPSTGFLPFQARQLGFQFGLDASQVQQLTRIMQGMYRLHPDVRENELEGLGDLVRGRATAHIQKIGGLAAV